LTVCCGAGCGPRPLADQLVRAFHDELAVDLHVRPSPKLPGFPSAVALKPSAEAQRRYGEFHIVIFDSATEARLMAHNKRPDPRGVDWTKVYNELSLDPPIWCAQKLYGRVVLRWWNPERRVTDDWRRLDEAVRKAVATAR
jgi:hypothetical protein